MPKARGGTGTVRGVTPVRVQRYIQRVIEHVRKKHEGEFTRAIVRAYLSDESNLTHNQAEGIAFALTWPPGLSTKIDTGLFRLAPNAEELAAHRNWRFNVGRIGLEDTRRLIAALRVERKKNGALTETLEGVYRRGEKALRNVKLKGGS